jgi:5,5'-dehydrodivanillate O-demethylase
MGEEFALYRGESGNAHLIAAHCAHRGTHLSVGWVEGDCLRCAYHGWVYDGSGQCIEQPAEDEGYARRVRIPGYPTQEYLGLIFAYLGEGEAPPLPCYPEFEEEGVLEVDCATRPYNYYQTLENGGDWVHVAFAHGKRIRDADGRFRIPEMVAEETEWGYRVQLTYPGRSTQVVDYGLPNIHYHPKKVRLPRRLRRETGVEWVDSLAWRAVPIDDQSFNLFEVTLIRVTGEQAQYYQQARAEAHEAAAMTPSTAELARSVMTGARNFTDLEDLDEIQATRMGNVGDFVTQAAQGAIADRRHERLGRSDVAVVLLRKIWERELRALAEGRPVKRWDRPDDMIVRAAPLEAYG